MNLDKLIAAAREIDELAEKQEQEVKAWSTLASDARKPDADKEDIERRRKMLERKSPVVTDYGTAINKLRFALRSKPSQSSLK